MMKIFIQFIIAVFFTTNLSAQKIIKDTTIDSITYKYAEYRLNGKIKVLSQNKTKKSGGEFIYFDKKGKELWSGEYNCNGLKDGAWWYKKREITWFYNGKKTGKKGSGCKGCSF